MSAVLQAATRILREEGVEALTIPHLCKVAGVSPGSVYQYFPSKEAVVYALLRDHAERVTTSMAAVLHEHGMSEPGVLIDAAVDAFIDEHRHEPAVHSALGRIVATQAGPGLEGDLMARIQAGLASLLAARGDELGGRDPEVTAFLLIRTLESVVHAATRDQPDLLNNPEFARGLKGMLASVVGMAP